MSFKMPKMSDELDYTIKNIDDRLALVNKIVKKNEPFLIDYYDNYYNPHLNNNSLLSENTRIGKDLETLANYLLYLKDDEQPDDIITEYKEKRNNLREASINKLIKVKDAKKQTNKSIIKYPKIKVTKKDREMYKDLAQTGEVIERLTKMIESGVDSQGRPIPQSEIRRLKWMRTDIQKDEIVMKHELKGYITFKSITKSEKDYNALSYIRFDDKEIIRILIEDYSDLKAISFDDTYGYLKLIMIVFEQLVDDTPFDDYMKDILIWKIDGKSYDFMLEQLKEKYGIKLTKPRLSKITRETIPNMIVETYKQKKEDWVYTFVLKGNYKTCSSCKKNYLATTKYFSPDKKSKSGLRSICKNCRKKKYKMKAVAKNE
jgi:tellurite resistance-related uncharacterized protein